MSRIGGNPEKNEMGKYQMMNRPLINPIIVSGSCDAAASTEHQKNPSSRYNNMPHVFCTGNCSSEIHACGLQMRYH